VSISNFELIKEQPYKSDVFVELDDEAKLVWKNIEEIINIKDVFERKKEFTKIKPKFYDYVASVDVRNNTPEFKYFIYFVGYDSLLLFYDKSTGFRNKGDDFIGL
jgi:CRISPR-associated endonuclease/helicase Cas3